MTRLEVRCPTGPKRLLLILVQSGDRVTVVPGNLIELSCPDCKRLRRRAGDPVLRVLHRYSLPGDLVETVSEY